MIGVVIFDLDGTLIDSAPSILTALDFAIGKSGLTPHIPLNKSIIGPPLREMMVNLVGSEKSIDLDVLMQDFKSFYDNEGYKFSEPYLGIHDMLEKLLQARLPLYLATNKRYLPTRKIIKFLGWERIFGERIYALDKYAERQFTSKALMIEALLREQEIYSNSAVYVGDRIEDFDAATANNISTILVKWGYGELHNQSADLFKIAPSVDGLFNIIVSS